MYRSVVIVCTTSAILFAAGRAACAGPIDPPSGPVSGSMKPLDQLEPRIAINAANTPGDADSLFRITQAGSYYLTGNVQGASGKSGIEIVANGVTLDLNGFRLAGVPGSLDGVRTSIAVAGVVVRGGAADNWGENGIDLGTSFSCAVRDVTATFNGQTGIDPGDEAVVTGCTARQNGSAGISSGSHCVIRECTASDNGGIGIFVYGASIAEACTAQQNGDSGFDLGNGSTARGCAASKNGGSGFECSDSTQILDCIANFNSLYGIDAGWGVQISRCSADGNDGHGIEFGSYCTVTDNACRQNGLGAAGGAGLYMASGSSRARIEGNNCAQNDWGIRIDGTSNLVYGNTCTSNGSNYEIVANNRVGQVVTLPLSGAVSGNTGGNSTGADPVCNMAF